MNLDALFNGSAVRRFFIICTGALFYGASLGLFLAPNDLAPGGVGGISIMLNSFFPIGVGSFTMLLSSFRILLSAFPFRRRILKKYVRRY